MGENIFLNHCHAMEFTCISTVGTRGVFSTFQLTCNTSTDHKNKNLRSSLLSTVEQKKKRKKKGGTYTDSLPRCLRFFLLFIYINTSVLYIYIFKSVSFSEKSEKIVTVPNKEESAVVLLWKCRRFRISRRPVTPEGDRLVCPGRRRRQSRSSGQIWL